MPIKAIIYDLDNTLYPVSAIGERLFAGLFAIIRQSGEAKDRWTEIRKDIMRRPFQVVALQYGFSPALTKMATGHLEHLRYEEPIDTFEDYPIIKEIPGERFLVTTGFKDLQESKIKAMSIADDFAERHIIDPLHSRLTKKEVFADIMRRRGYQAGDLLVVGDDPESEIRAAQALGIKTVLYDNCLLYTSDAADE